MRSILLALPLAFVGCQSAPPAPITPLPVSEVFPVYYRGVVALPDHGEAPDQVFVTAAPAVEALRVSIRFFELSADLVRNLLPQDPAGVTADRFAAMGVGLDPADLETVVERLEELDGADASDRIELRGDLQQPLQYVSSSLRSFVSSYELVAANSAVAVQPKLAKAVEGTWIDLSLERDAAGRDSYVLSLRFVDLPESLQTVGASFRGGELAVQVPVEFRQQLSVQRPLVPRDVLLLSTRASDEHNVVLTVVDIECLEEELASR